MTARFEPNYWAEMHGDGLSAAARVTFVHVLTSGTVWGAGIAPLTPSRWATLTALSVDVVDAAVTELDDAGYLVVDRSTSEVFIPTWWSLTEVDRQWMSAPSSVMHCLGPVVSERLRAAALAPRKR